MYGFTLSALTRYTFLAHKTRILSLPFEVMILYVAVPEMRSLKSHAPPHTRAATPHPFRPLRCTTQGRCFIHTSRSCTVKYGFGSQACWRREQIVAPPSNPGGWGGYGISFWSSGAAANQVVSLCMRPTPACRGYSSSTPVILRRARLLSRKSSSKALAASGSSRKAPELWFLRLPCPASCFAMGVGVGVW